ncbi:MAG TPA: type II secretion system protein [Pyrinomonadaceae bacterium]|nr:type II secretion system protein [Pyrinomonadaceae bacterium]
MIYLQERPLSKTERGDAVIAVEPPGRRVILSRFVPAHLRGSGKGRSGFTLIELVITVAVLSILTLGVVPLMKLSVKRQKEAQLRDTLRQVRMAIDEFHRDTVNMICTGTVGPVPGSAPPPGYVDPRSKVVISDCTIFGVDNPDRYPPDLETLINGVNVIPRGGITGGRSDPNVPATEVGGQLSTKKKVYLRGLPIDPMTGNSEWGFRSSYDAVDSDSWGHENLFDVYSKSKDTALNGEKYSDW